MDPTGPHAAGIRSGFAGMGTPIRLDRAGLDLTTFEHAAAIDGAWRLNDYRAPPAMSTATSSPTPSPLRGIPPVPEGTW